MKKQAVLSISSDRQKVLANEIEQVCIKMCKLFSDITPRGWNQKLGFIDVFHLNVKLMFTDNNG